MQWTACGEAHIPAGTDWLTPPEQRRVDGYRFTKRRTEYLLRRCAGKRAVAAALGWLDGSDPGPFTDQVGSAATDRRRAESELGRIGVLNRPGGAPYVEIDGQPAAMDISLTDRAGWAVALLGEPGTMAGGTIGVDLEVVEPRSAAFVADYFTAAEQGYVRDRTATSGADGHHMAANLIWSAKEAALKVLRVGLRADTRRVEVAVDHTTRPDGWAPLSVTTAGGTRFPGWWRRDGVYLLTIAYAGGAPAPPHPLPGSADLATATPTHSWLARPRLD